MQSNYTLSDDPLSLTNIRSVLIRLEETIIFGLIERAQFAHNPRIYIRGAFPELRKEVPSVIRSSSSSSSSSTTKPTDSEGADVATGGFDGSWLEWFLHETECFHGTHPIPSV